MSGDVIKHGTFRLDRRAALDKLERFRFDEPGQYIEELLAAAVCAGAPEVHIVVDSDDLIVSWQADPLSEDELSTVLDPLFGQADSRHQAMRQHLAAGVLGAHATHPRWLHIDSGDGIHARRVDLVDPLHTPCSLIEDRVDGVRVHVRDRFGLRVLQRATLGTARPTMTHLQRAVVRYPLPVWVNGSLMERARDDRPVVLHISDTIDGYRIHLTLHPDGRSGIDWLRNGLVVGQVPAEFVGCVSGWVEADDLTLNASRTEPVRDAVFRRATGATREALTRLYDSVASLTPEQATEPLVHGTGTTTRHAVLRRLATVFPDGPPRSWDTVPVVDDVFGTAWSRAELRRNRGPVAVTSVLPEAPTRSQVVFPLRTKARLAQLGIPTTDITSQIKLENQGFRRRQKQMASRQPFDFGESTEQRRFVSGALRGSVRIADSGMVDLNHTLRVRMQIDGLVVEELALPSPSGPLQAVLDSPEFSTNGTFTHVRDDAVRQEALRHLRAQCHRLVLEYTERIATTRPRLSLSWASLAIGDLQRFTHVVDHAELLDQWYQRPLLQRVDQAKISVHDARDQAPEGGWLVAKEVQQAALPHDVLRRVLLVPQPLQDIYVHALGVHASTGAPLARLADDYLDELAHGHRRRNTQREAVVVPSSALHTRRVDEPGVHARFGWTRREADAGVRVLSDGRFVTLVRSELLPGLCGVIDLDEAEVNLAHTEVLGTSKKQVDDLLRRAADDVAVAWWTTADAPDDALLMWRTHTTGHAARRAVDDCPVAQTWGGQVVTVHELIASAKRWRVLTKPPRFRLLESCLVATPALIELITRRARHPPVIADPTAAAMARVYLTFLQKPRWQPPTAVLAAQDIPLTDGGTAHAWLPNNPADIGQSTAWCVWEDRPLGEASTWRSAGAHVAARADTIQPNGNFSAPHDRSQLTRLRTVAEDAIAPLIALALTCSPVAEHLPAYRALAAQVMADRKAPRPAREALIDLPLLRSVNGLLTLRELDAHRGAVFRVEPSTPPGPTDDALYVLDQDFVAPLLHAVRGRVAEGTERLRAYRKTVSNLASLPPHPGQLLGEHILRDEVDDSALSGQVGIVGPSSDQTGLRVALLFDDKLLATRHLTFPVAATATLWGPVIQPEDDYSDAQPSKGLDRALQRVRLQALNLLKRHSPSRETEAALRWAVRAAVADSSLSHWELFERADGTAVAFAELMEGTPPIPAVPQRLADAVRPVLPNALVVPESIWSFLADLVPLDDLSRRLSAPTPPLATIGSAHTLEDGGCIAVSPDPQAALTVCAQGLVLMSVHAVDHGLPLPLAGWLSCDVHPAVLFRDGPDRITRRLSRQLTALSPSLFQALERHLNDHGTDEERRMLRHFLLTHFPRPELAAAHENTLLSLPLWPTVDAGWVSTHTVFTAPLVYRVAEPTGRSEDGELIIACTDTEAAWLSATRRIDDGEELLGNRLAGRVRRNGPAHRPSVPRGANIHHMALPSGGTGRLWRTHPSLRGVLDITVGDRLVCTTRMGAPGFHVVIDGAYRTNDAFTQATGVDDDIAEAHQQVRDALRHDWKRAPHAVWDRIIAAEPIRDDLLWTTPLFRYTDGSVASLADLAERSGITWTTTQDAGDEDSPSLLLSASDAARLEHRLPSTSLFSLATVRAERMQRQRKDVERRRSRAASRLAKRVARAVDGAVDTNILLHAAEQLVPHLGESEPTARHLAWVLARALHTAERYEDEAALMTRLATALAEQAR